MKYILFFIFYISYISKTYGDIGIFKPPDLKDAVDEINSIRGDIKNKVATAIDAVKSIGQEAVQSSKATKVEKVERIPVPDLIEKYGYPSETHTVETSDGYILEVHRIPRGKTNETNGKVVLLQHGLLGASSDWVLFGPEHGLAFMLADAGYDVWMGNSRGNLYSRKHKTLDPKMDVLKFWAFSWHEMGLEDLPATIDYILKKTSKEKLYYIGHGQGTTVFYVMASSKPEYNAKIKAQISMAPMGYMGNLFSPILRALALKTLDSQALFQLIGNSEFLPKSGILDFITDKACNFNAGPVLCKNALFAISGFSPKQINTTSLPLITAHYPSGAATKQVLHYVQEINLRKFCQFDYGPLNLIRYKSPLPTSYDVSKITTPVIFIYSDKDWLAAEIDVTKLYNKLPHGKEKYKIEHESWNHLDFIFGNDAPAFVYAKVKEFLGKY